MERAISSEPSREGGLDLLLLENLVGWRRVRDVEFIKGRELLVGGADGDLSRQNEIREER